MADIEVRHEYGDRFLVLARGHAFTVDQPIGSGGDDFGPTPTELFVAGLAACVGHYAGRFLRRHELPTEGLAVHCDFRMSEVPPSRVTEIEIKVDLPEVFPEARRRALQRVVERCTVHNSMVQTPDVSISLSTAGQLVH